MESSIANDSVEPSRVGLEGECPDWPCGGVVHDALVGDVLLTCHRSADVEQRPQVEGPLVGRADTLRGHRVLHLVGKGNKPATMPVTVPVLRVLEACRGQRTSGLLVLRPVSGKSIDRRDAYRMVNRIAKTAKMPRHISPHSLRHAAITYALDAGVPLRDAQILARHAEPRTTEHYDRARGNLTGTASTS